MLTLRFNCCIIFELVLRKTFDLIEIQKKLKDISVAIVGDGEERENIEKLISKMSDIETAVKNESIETKDEDIINLTNRVKELQEHISKIMGE